MILDLYDRLHKHDETTALILYAIGLDSLLCHMSVCRVTLLTIFMFNVA